MANRRSPGYVAAARSAGPMPSFVLSEFVEPELSAIWDYIAMDNGDAADRFLEAAYRTFHALAGLPHLGRGREFGAQRLQSLRSLGIDGFENFTVFYLPLPDGVEILHVLHGARDLERFWASR